MSDERRKPLSPHLIAFMVFVGVAGLPFIVMPLALVEETFIGTI